MLFISAVREIKYQKHKNKQWGMVTDLRGGREGRDQDNKGIQKTPRTLRVVRLSLSWAEKWTELFIKLLFECLKYSTIFLNVQSLGTKVCSNMQARTRDTYYVLYLYSSYTYTVCTIYRPYSLQ